MATTTVNRKAGVSRRGPLALLAVCALAGLAQAQGSDVATRFGGELDTQVARGYPSLDALYKDIHAHPELAFEEVDTAKKLAAAMRELDFEVTEGIAMTGLVAMDPAKIKRMPPATPTDDFAELVGAGVPSMFFFIGVHDPKAVEASRQPGGKPLPINHSPFFAPVPEPSIKQASRP